MEANASMKVPLAERAACNNCGHLHRPALSNKCKCCMADYIALKEFGVIDV